MPTYILLSSLTAQGVQTLKSNPDRLREVNKDVEELGAKVDPPVGDARRVRLRQRRRGPGCGDDRARVGLARRAGQHEDPHADRADDRRVSRRRYLEVLDQRPSQAQFRFFSRQRPQFHSESQIHFRWRTSVTKSATIQARSWVREKTSTFATCPTRRWSCNGPVGPFFGPSRPRRARAARSAPRRALTRTSRPHPLRRPSRGSASRPCRPLTRRRRADRRSAVRARSARRSRLHRDALALLRRPGLLRIREAYVECTGVSRRLRARLRRRDLHWPRSARRFTTSVRPSLCRCRNSSTNGVTACPRTPARPASARAASINGSTSSRLVGGGCARTMPLPPRSQCARAIAAASAADSVRAGTAGPPPAE